MDNFRRNIQGTPGADCSGYSEGGHILLRVSSIREVSQGVAVRVPGSQRLIGSRVALLVKALELNQVRAKRVSSIQEVPRGAVKEIPHTRGIANAQTGHIQETARNMEVPASDVVAQARVGHILQAQPVIISRSPSRPIVCPVPRRPMISFDVVESTILAHEEHIVLSMMRDEPLSSPPPLKKQDTGRQPHLHLRNPSEGEPFYAINLDSPSRSLRFLSNGELQPFDEEEAREGNRRRHFLWQCSPVTVTVIGVVLIIVILTPIVTVIALFKNVHPK